MPEDYSDYVDFYSNEYQQSLLTLLEDYLLTSSYNFFMYAHQMVHADYSPQNLRSADIASWIVRDAEARVTREICSHNTKLICYSKRGKAENILYKIKVKGLFNTDLYAELIAWIDTWRIEYLSNFDGTSIQDFATAQMVNYHLDKKCFDATNVKILIKGGNSRPIVPHQEFIPEDTIEVFENYVVNDTEVDLYTVDIFEEGFENFGSDSYPKNMHTLQIAFAEKMSSDHFHKYSNAEELFKNIATENEDFANAMNTTFERSMLCSEPVYDSPLGALRISQNVNNEEKRQQFSNSKVIAVDLGNAARRSSSETPGEIKVLPFKRVDTARSKYMAFVNIEAEVLLISSTKAESRSLQRKEFVRTETVRFFAPVSSYDRGHYLRNEREVSLCRAIASIPYNASEHTTTDLNVENLSVDAIYQAFTKTYFMKAMHIQSHGLSEYILENAWFVNSEVVNASHYVDQNSEVSKYAELIPAGMMIPHGVFDGAIIKSKIAQSSSFEQLSNLKFAHSTLLEEKRKAYSPLREATTEIKNLLASSDSLRSDVESETLELHYRRRHIQDLEIEIERINSVISDTEALINEKTAQIDNNALQIHKIYNKNVGYEPIWSPEQQEALESIATTFESAKDSIYSEAIASQETLVKQITSTNFRSKLAKLNFAIDSISVDIREDGRIVKSVENILEAGYDISELKNMDVTCIVGNTIVPSLMKCINSNGDIDSYRSAGPFYFKLIIDSRHMRCSLMLAPSHTQSIVAADPEDDGYIMLHPHSPSVYLRNEASRTFQAPVSPCLGELAPMLINATRDNNLTQLMVGLKGYLETCNLSDVWGRRGKAFPPTSDKDRELWKSILNEVAEVDVSNPEDANCAILDFDSKIKECIDEYVLESVNPDEFVFNINEFKETVDTPSTESENSNPTPNTVGGWNRNYQRIRN